MSSVNLILSLPQGMITATSLGIPGYVWHRSPGTSPKFLGRSIFVDLDLEVRYENEGGWRDAEGDTRRALEAVRGGKRTKTALSNDAFNCTPFDAWRHVHLARSTGELLELEPRATLASFASHGSAENLDPNQVARAAGLPEQVSREPRLYLVISPVELLVLTNLTPEEYVWYSTHRSGKVFRRVLFAELAEHPEDLAAFEVYDSAFKELSKAPTKKTKTIRQGESFSRVPYEAWLGWPDDEMPGGLYGGDKNGAFVSRFPKQIPRAWGRAQ